MDKVRIGIAPRQDDCRVAILGAVLWPESIVLHSVVEADSEEIADPRQRGDQGTMFGIIDNLGNEYGPGSGRGSGSSRLHVTEWVTTHRPGVPPDASRLFVVIWVRGSVFGRVEIQI
jgi:hypothetical protein